MTIVSATIVIGRYRVCSKNVYFLIVQESGLCFCSCENPGLLSQSDTEVKAMEEYLVKLFDEISCLQKTRIICFLTLSW